jgi:hypothetical protein
VRPPRFLDAFGVGDGDAAPVTFVGDGLAGAQAQAGTEVADTVAAAATGAVVVGAFAISFIVV